MQTCRIVCALNNSFAIRDKLEWIESYRRDGYIIVLICKSLADTIKFCAVYQLDKSIIFLTTQQDQ
jgi:tRNA uridine 5-carbamoylmethylation protein Kti12